MVRWRTAPEARGGRGYLLRPSAAGAQGQAGRGDCRADGKAPRDVEFYRPVLDTMLSIFGSERLIYASNWPVSERFAPLATVQGIIQDYFSSQGRQMEERIFSGNGQTAYRWTRRLESP